MTHKNRHGRIRSLGGGILAAAGLTLVACSGGPRTTAPLPVEVHEASIDQLQAAMAEGRTTSAEIVTAYLERIRAYDESGPALNAFIHLDAEGALERAAALDRERAEHGPRGPLHGIPVVVKDNFNTIDMPTTGGSIALAGMVPPEDATVVRHLREAGAVILGKTNLHEMAFGYTSVSSLGGQTRNPYDPTRTPGGSSGGTGAAVAASFAAIGWGSDTCGSIRVPAVFNGLFGLRPTKGVGSIHGMIPLARTQDVPGPLARTVSDLAIGLDATVGFDPADPATEILRDAGALRFSEALREDALAGARIGILVNYFGTGDADLPVGTHVRAAIERMEELGAQVVEVELPGLSELLSSTSVIVQEFRHDLEDYLAAIPSAPIRTLSEIVENGLHHQAVAGALGASNAVATRDTDTYRETLERQRALRAAVLEFMGEEELDALAYPTTTRPPAPIENGQAGVQCQLSAATGLPAMAVPAPLTEEGLPVGFELLGRPLDDARLVGMAFAYEQGASPRVPPPSTPPLPRPR